MAGIYKVFYHSCARDETKIILLREFGSNVVYYCPGCHLMFMFTFDELSDKELGDGK